MNLGLLQILSPSDLNFAMYECNDNSIELNSPDPFILYDHSHYYYEYLGCSSTLRFYNRFRYDGFEILTKVL